jgi:hypothetical protein
VVGIVSLLLASSAFTQVDRSELGRALNLDLLPVAMASEKEVTGIDLDSGTLSLDDEKFSLRLFTEGESLLEGPPLQSSIDLKSLRVGERVIVETDGTAPSDTHIPHITAIRRP